MTTVLISQSNYIPWRGYFDLIHSAGMFVILDDVQYTHQDWRNRNRIKTSSGLSWLTIPVMKDRAAGRICETMIADRSWADKHWRRLEPAYRQARCFPEAAAVLEPLYRHAARLSLLSDVNRLFLTTLCSFLGIRTRIHSSTDFFSLEALQRFNRNQRNLQLCLAAGATHYVSGPSARDYMDMELFDRAGIEVRFADYSRYPEYPQLHGPFVPDVSIVDLLFNAGDRACDYALGFAL
jgi:hypothetical protein